MMLSLDEGTLLQLNRRGIARRTGVTGGPCRRTWPKSPLRSSAGCRGSSNTVLMAPVNVRRTIHTMKRSTDVAATLEALHTAIRQAATCSGEELIVALVAVTGRCQTQTPIAVVARRGTSASAD